MTVQFNYKLQGNRDLPVALFLHGFLGNYQEFDPITQGLLGFCCLSVDLPGHGATRVVGDDAYTMANTAIALIHLLDTLEITQATLVGYSMGGRLALYLALHFPERFPKAVVESASPGLKTEAERCARVQHDCAWADRIEANFADFLAQWYEQPLFESLRQHPQFEQIVQQRSQQFPTELAKSLRAMSTGHQPSLWKKLQAHQNPILLIVGARDRKFIAINQEMQSLCKTATLVIVPHTGHNVHIEDPHTYQHYLRAFLLQK